LSKSVDLQYCHHYILDNLITIDHSIGRYPIIYVLEAHIKLHPFDSHCRLCSFGPSGGTPSCLSPFDDFAKSITLLVRPPLRILVLLPLFLSVSALSMKRHHRNMSEPFHDFLTSCALRLCGRIDRWFTFDWLTSCPDCNLALNCDGLPRHFSSQDLQDGKC
jgi:hypothetical protein